MAGNTFGELFRVTTCGESHGYGLMAIVDGCPPGMELSEEDIQPDLDRRRPGTGKFTTMRNEPDTVKIVSGVFEGKTTGTPIGLLITNVDQHSKDYADIARTFRPGHADYTFDAKYGFRDYRGGGRSSGRETLCRVAAGAVAAKLLKELGIDVCSYTRSIGPVSIDPANFDRALITTLPTCMPDQEANDKALEYLESVRSEADSAGGVIETVISGMPAGIGDPVFDKLSADLAKAIMSIGAMKALEFGDGIGVSSAKGSENNDAFRMDGDKVTKATNHSGGLLGGMSDGSDIIIRSYVKPTPSIFKTQETVTKDNEDTRINIEGRHDPIIVPRAVVVVESMCAITLADALMTNMSARLDSLKTFYRQ